MRADRLLAMLLLLRRGPLVTAKTLALELGVSERTVLRDVEALSTAGVPVYAERGRSGGFRLLPGWTTDLSGLSGDEARALLIAGSATASTLGIGAAFSSGLAKVLSSLPAEGRRSAAVSAARILVLDNNYFGRTDHVPALGTVQQAVTGNRRMTISYRSGTLLERRDPAARPASTRTLDPAGLVSAAGVWYLLALHRAERRIYRVDRIEHVKVLPEPVAAPVDPADLAPWWEDSRSRFLDRIADYDVVLEVPAHDDDGVAALIAGVHVVSETAPSATGRRFRARFADAEHARTALWRLVDRVRVVAPSTLRKSLRDSAAAVLAAQHD